MCQPILTWAYLRVVRLQADACTLCIRRRDFTIPAMRLFAKLLWTLVQFVTVGC